MKSLGSHYIGRFAPSPSGSLHFGSLVTALASYVDAKHHHGQWLVRMEDIDPPREEVGAKSRILETLRAHGLHWDGDIMYQSSRLTTYARVLSSLKPMTYLCRCTRKRIEALNGVYDGHCLQNPIPENSTSPSATRINLQALAQDALFQAEHFDDLFQGSQHQTLYSDVGDFILQRKDGLFAYQLAVAIDDISQGITHIIRGSDLLPSTPRQRFLLLLLQQEQGLNNTALPIYGHIPVATNHLQQKLSKQHKAPAINNDNAFDNLCAALAFLHQTVPAEVIAQKNIALLLLSAIERWQRNHIPQTRSLVVKV
jgi:glutamyl-Q tRNA(Asp) synthetase